MWSIWHRTRHMINTAIRTWVTRTQEVLKEKSQLSYFPTSQPALKKSRSAAVHGVAESDTTRLSNWTELTSVKGTDTQLSLEKHGG